MVDLPPEIEELFAACAQRTATSAAEVAALKADVDELVDTLDGEGLAEDAIPEEARDDPSVVRHILETTATAARVRRISTPQPARVHEAVLRMGSTRARR